MADGVKFLIDLDSRTRGANDAIRGLHGIENAAEQANQQLHQMDHGAHGLQANVFSAEFAVHALEHAWEGAKEVVEKIYDTVKETIATVANAGREKMVLTNLLGDPEIAEEQMEYLEKFSQLSEFTVKQSQAFGIELMKAGYKGQEFRNALEAVADAASLSSDGLAGAQHAMESLDRMKLTGKMDARSLKGLGLNVKDVMKDLGDALGMSPKAVKKALEQGAVPAAKAFESVLRGLERKTGKGLGEAGMAAGRGLEAKMTHLRELPERLMEKLEGSPAMLKFEHLFDKALSAFDPDSAKGSKIVGGLERLMGSIAEVLEDTDWDGAAASISGIGMSLGTWIDPLSKIAKFLAKITEAMLALPLLGHDIGNLAGDVRTNLQRNSFEAEMAGRKGKVKSVFTDVGPNSRQTSFAREVLDKAAQENEAGWAGISEADIARARANGATAAGKPIPDISHAKPHAGGGPVTATAHVSVHVDKAGASAEEIGAATRDGAREGMTKAIEAHTLQKGLRPAKAGGNH